MFAQVEIYFLKDPLELHKFHAGGRALRVDNLGEDGIYHYYFVYCHGHFDAPPSSFPLPPPPRFPLLPLLFSSCCSFSEKPNVC
jgi:hypothetical protein